MITVAEQIAEAQRELCSATKVLSAVGEKRQARL